jgi:hypothetical protein
MKPQNPVTPSMPIVVRRRQVLALPLLLAGCADPYVLGGGGDTRPPPGPQPGPQRVATLDVEGEVEVTQGGRRFRGQDGNALFRGDEVRTFANSYAAITFVDGDRVWLDYDTRVRVGSLFAYFGRVFASVSGIFQVDSEFVAASSEGTEYTVTVGRGGRNNFSVAVRSGVVRCQPRRGRWAPIRLGASQRLRAMGDAQPAIDRIDAREAQEEFGWVGRVSRPPIPRQQYVPSTRPQSPTTPPQPTQPPAPQSPPPRTPAPQTPAPQTPAPQTPGVQPPLTRPPSSQIYRQPPPEPVIR